MEFFVDVLAQGDPSKAFAAAIIGEQQIPSAIRPAAWSLKDYIGTAIVVQHIRCHSLKLVLVVERFQGCMSKRQHIQKSILILPWVEAGHHPACGWQARTIMAVLDGGQLRQE